MTAEWDEKSVFLRAISLEGEERERYLREACADEESLERMRRLVAAHEDASSPFFEPAETAGGTADDIRLPEAFDEFRIIRSLGVGGMGVVYLARDQTLDRTVALKVLSPRLTDSAKARARFADEARLAASLRHPSIVTVYKFGHVGDAFYIASEYVEGPTFEDLVRRHRETRSTDNANARRQWRREAAEACAAVAEALQAAHAARIVHRDVKPSNILMDERSGARLTDFGIAKRITEADLTEQTAVVGSCHYMSPEQASIRAQRVDERSDVFSLGVTLYEALALRKPFDGDTVHDVLRAIQNIDAPRLRTLDRGVDRDLETICHKALEKRPEDRYQTAAHMAADLRCWLHDDPILARPPGLARRSRRFLRRHWRPSLAAAVVLLLLATVWVVRLGESARANLAFLREAAGAPVESMATADLAEVVARGARLLRARGDLPDDLERMRASVNETLSERVESARAALADIDGSIGREEEASRAGRFAAVQREARDLAVICMPAGGASPFVEDALVGAAQDLATQNGAAFVTVNTERLEDSPADYRVTVSSLMQHPGSPVEVSAGDASEQLRVDRGYYRLAVHHPDGRVREFTCTLRLREHRTLDPDWSKPVTTEDMALVEGATLTWPAIANYTGVTVRIEPFLIDRYEVSNRQYRAYFDTLDRTDRERRRPTTWGQGGYPHGRPYGGYEPHPWDDLPVGGVSWFSANAYAAWAGKRLPSYAEWTLAAVGPEWRTHPFAAEDLEGRLPANIYADVTARYADSVMPVTSMPEGATPEGVHHMYGNVYEWSESVGFVVDDDNLKKPAMASRMLLGYAWDAAAQGYLVGGPRRYEADQFAAHESIGFRCAMSLDASNTAAEREGAP